MALPTYKTKAEIPAGFEELYEERDGAWHPKPSPDVGTLERTLAKVREEKKDEERARKAAEETRGALERQLAAATTGEDKERVTKALAKFDTDLAAKKAEFDAELAKKDATIRQFKLTDRARDAFLKAGGRPERAEKMATDTAARLDLDGDRIVVKNDKGEVTTQSVEDFFGKSYRAEMPEFYRGTQGAGGGAQGGGHTLPSAMADREKLLSTPGGGRALIEAANAEAK